MYHTCITHVSHMYHTPVSHMYHTHVSHMYHTHVSHTCITHMYHTHMHSVVCIKTGTKMAKQHLKLLKKRMKFLWIIAL